MCRLIDADKLLNKIDAYMCGSQDVMFVKELIKEQPTVHKSLRYMYEKGYNNGVDETCNYICREWSLDRINTCEDFDKISQQLKGR